MQSPSRWHLSWEWDFVIVAQYLFPTPPISGVRGGALSHVTRPSTLFILRDPSVHSSGSNSSIGHSSHC